jgi:hypothetical protein
VDLRQALERLDGLVDDAVVAQLLSFGMDPVPLAELSGTLTVDATDVADQRRVLRVGGNTIWIWPDRFIEANPVGTNGALELVTKDVIFIVGPASRAWID